MWYKLDLVIPPPSSADLSPEQYRDEPHEVEAWEEAFDLFKGLRPGARGTVKIEGRAYTMPETSSYVIDRSKLPSYIIN